jgi:tetratricopeptide (TPR) repeat protein
VSRVVNSSQEVSDLFASMWTEIRSSHLVSGQPRGERSGGGVALAQEALSIASRSDDPILRAEAHRMMAYALNANEEYELSISHYRDALESLDVTDGKQEIAARTRLGLIAALLMSGRYSEALQTGESAQAWFLANGDDISLAKLYTNLGNVYHRLDDHARSLEYHEKARTIFKAKGDQRALALSTLNMANSLSSLDRLIESDSHYATAERLSRQMDMPELLIQARYNRAYLLFLRGRFSDALKSFAALRQQFTTQHSLRHTALCDLDEAEIYLQLNVSDDAAMLAQRAIDAFGKLGMRYEQAKAMAFLGIALTQKSEWTEAPAVFRQAQRLFEEERNDYWTALLDLYRAEILFSSRRLCEAQSLAESAQKRFENADIPSKHALCLILLAGIASDLNQRQSARQYAEDALRLARTHKMPLLLFRTLATNAEILERLSETDQAKKLYEQAADEIELSRSYLERDDLKVAFLAGKQAVFESLARITLNGSEASESMAAVAEAFGWCERSKARALIDLLSSHVSGIGGQAQPSLLNRVRRLHEELNSQHVRASAETRIKPTPANAGVHLKEHELSKILGELSQADPEYVSLQKVSVASVESIQQLLPENTTLVEYFSIRNEIIAFVINSRRVDVARHLCPVSRVEHLQECLSFQLECFHSGPDYIKGHEEQLNASVQAHLKDLYQALVAPIRDQLDTRRVIVVPHGVIHYLPFHAFFDGSQYLLDDYSISYAPSASVLKYCLEKDDIHGSRPLLVGIPDGNAPQIRTELAQLSSIFPGARRLEGRQATRRAFRRESAAADFVHIATHAVFRKDNPMFSAFKLGDEWINALDLYNMSCNANLVTLSGCSSGMQQVAGGDDLLGLVRGFLYAGARSLLLSLWPIGDESTASLMKYFYAYWSEGAPKAVALQQAGNRLRHDYPHPFFWAPFVLIGKP